MKPSSRQAHVSGAVAIALAWLVVGARPVLALNPALDVSQYMHTSWKIRDGFTKGAITSIAQTPDGYLWLGTEFGLVRFDGVRAVPWQPPREQPLPSSFILNLLVARDGTLWIGTDQGLASWKDGKLTRHEELAGSWVGKLLEDREGSIWAARFASSVWTLCTIQKGRVQCQGEDGGPGANAVGLYEDTKANLWVGTRTGLWRWRPDPARFYPLPLESNGVQGISEDDDGTLLISYGGGIRRLVNGQAEMTHPFPPSMRPPQANRLLRDRDGGVWIGSSTGGGLAHLHRGIADVFAQPDGLSGNSVTALLEDREGNIWVATSDGLDRFRDAAVASFSLNQGLSNAQVTSVVASNDGSVWVGTFDGLNRWEDGQVTVYRERSARAPLESSPRVSRKIHQVTGAGMPANGVQSVFQDHRGRVWVATRPGVGFLENDRFVPVRGLPGGITRAIVEDGRENLWIANLDSGLFRVPARGGDIEVIPWTTFNHKDQVTVIAADPARAGLWLGFFHGGIVFFADGRLRASYAAVDGLAEGRVTAIQAGRDGALWVATDGGLSRLKDGRMATLTSKNGLPCNAVSWLVEDDAHSLWLGMGCGLARIGRDEMDAWVAVGKDTGNHDATRQVQVTLFDNVDGARIPVKWSGAAPAAKASDGKLWFVATDGVSVVDPRHLPFNTLPPPVHIEQIIADRKTYDATAPVNGQFRLPALSRDLQIDYTALSFVTPEKNRFRIKLDGWDRDWQDVGNRRQAFYSSLPPRNYRFRVIASNNSGVWNEAGTSLDFSVAPAYYQTLRFRLMIVAVAVGFLVALHLLRLRRLAWQFNLRLEERVNERTRVARDLHDTLLQSFHGLVLRFQAVTFLLPERPDEARRTLESALDDAGHALVEARDAVQGLRSATVVTSDLPSLIRALGEELAALHTDGHSAAFDVSVEGAPQDLVPLVRDEIYRIAREALRNAFRHAHASGIHVQIRYTPRALLLRIGDNGRGVDQEMIDQGSRTGHYGLTGMRERAELVEGTLTVWSEPGSGTEVELTIPASVAYVEPYTARRLRPSK